MGELVKGLPLEAQGELEAARERLRASRGVIIRGSELVAGFVGSAAAAGLRRLRPPATFRRQTQGLAEEALRRAFDVAVLGLPPDGSRGRLARRTLRLIVTASGAAGGLLGLPGFLPDVTVTTLLIMRRIAAIAVEEGEFLADPETRAACLEVFAFGRGSVDEPWEEGEQPELGYWSARLFLQGRPLVMLMSEAAATYGLRLSQKLAMQAVPLVGAAGGALVNTAFLAHYEALARAHFVIRRLERTYGAAAVRETAGGSAEARAGTP